MSAFAKARDFVGCAIELGDGLPAKLSILWRETKNLRVRTGLAAYHPHAIFSLRTTYGRLWFRDNFGDITNLSNLMYREVYSLPRTIGAGAILDVGANIGLAAAWFATRFPGRPIHCFEPLGANAQLISRNCPAAAVNEVAVGAAQGAVDLAVDADSIMASTIETRWDSSPRRLPVIRLDDYVIARSIGRIALLKIDTEGMELEVLLGASHTLTQTEQIAMETHELFRHRGVVEHLGSAGFHIDHEEFSGATGLVFASHALVGDRTQSHATSA